LAYTKKYKCCKKSIIREEKSIKKIEKNKKNEVLLKKMKMSFKYEEQQKAIIKHTKMNMAIRKKLKVMIHKLPVPDPIETIILNFVGVKKFNF
jgi:hypothetical protein